jgi:hypothetical protein
MRKFLLTTYLYILLAPAALLGVGAASNQVVLWENQGKFPVLVNDKLADHQRDDGTTVVGPDGFIDMEHVRMSSATHLNFLADIVNLGGDIYSVGDGLIYLGEWLGGFAMPLYVFTVTLKLRRLSYVNSDGNNYRG